MWNCCFWQTLSGISDDTKCVVPGRRKRHGFKFLSITLIGFVRSLRISVQCKSFQEYTVECCYAVALSHLAVQGKCQVNAMVK